MIKQSMKFLLLIPILFVLSGCFDKEQELINETTPVVKNSIKNLENQLRGSGVKNAIILKAYSKQLSVLKPELKELSDVFALEATPKSSSLKGFKDRFNIVNNNPKSFNNKKAIIGELRSLIKATQVNTYNDSLVDAINTLADLSEGKLIRVKEPKSKDGEKTQDAASRLVGNPTYGHWETNNGNSYWAWYGQYAMFSSLYNRPYYYHTWYYDRPWSYYNDYGRNTYSSRSERTQYSNLKTTNQKKLKDYGAKTGRNYSSYNPAKKNPKTKFVSTKRKTSSYQTKTAKDKNTVKTANKEKNYNNVKPKKKTFSSRKSWSSSSRRRR